MFCAIAAATALAAAAAPESCPGAPAVSESSPVGKKRDEEAVGLGGLATVSSASSSAWEASAKRLAAAAALGLPSLVEASLVGTPSLSLCEGLKASLVGPA